MSAIAIVAGTRLTMYKSSMRPEDQHYVPAGYLRSFCPDYEAALHIRRRRGNKWFRQKPENIATRKNFYSTLKADGTFDDRIEHLLARGIETPGLAALWRLKEGEDIPSWYTREGPHQGSDAIATLERAESGRCGLSV